jgi:Rod binding domain-containing protein
MQIQNSLNQKQFIKLSNQKKLNPLTRESPELHSSGQSEGKMDSSKIEDTKLKKACQDFESIFLSYLLKTMRSTIPKDELLEDNLGNDIFTSITDEEVAKKISQTQGLGIANMLYKEFTKFKSEETVPEKERMIHLDQIPSTQKAKEVSSLPSMDKVNRFEDHIHLAANKYEVSPQLIKAVIYHESGGDPKAVSPQGAKGLMQLVDSTAQEMGAKNIFDPKENILAGTKYLKSLIERFKGDLKLALAAYNAGPSIVEKVGEIPPFKETINFVNKVLRLAQNIG